MWFGSGLNKHNMDDRQELLAMLMQYYAAKTGVIGLDQFSDQKKWNDLVCWFPWWRTRHCLCLFKFTDHILRLLATCQVVWTSLTWEIHYMYTLHLSNPYVRMYLFLKFWSSIQILFITYQKHKIENDFTI